MKLVYQPPMLHHDALRWPAQDATPSPDYVKGYNLGRWPGQDCPLMDPARLKVVPGRMRELKPFPIDRKRAKK